MFLDRNEAGRLLAAALSQYRGADKTIVLGLPRGGVVVAYHVAQSLNLPFDVICPRKIGAPFNPEYAIGAITEGGKGIYNQDIIQRLGVTAEYVRVTAEKERLNAVRRLALFRKNRPPRDVSEKTVILIDDGLATGFTMKAAVESVRQEGAKKIIVAVPVGPRGTIEEMEALVDEVVCLSTPSFFEAIGLFYRDFTQVEDEEVIKLMAHENP